MFQELFEQIYYVVLPSRYILNIIIIIIHDNIIIL